jgi:rhamnosyltransferase
MIDKTSISIIIPVKNGAQTIKECLLGIFSQTLKDSLEVVIIDSGSTDGTLAIIKEFPVQLLQIAPDEFNHGTTRQLGVTKAHGEFVVLTVQDAVPATNNWLEIMLQHFVDEAVMGVCGQQVVPHHPDKNPLEWFRPISRPVPTTVQFLPEEFKSLKGKEQHNYCRWDDVNAMYRRKALLETPFSKTEFAEDALWAKSALEKGYKLVYDTSSRVYHYHHYSFKIAFARTYTVLHHTKLFFGYNRGYENFFKQFLIIFYRAYFKKHIPQRKFYWITYNISMLVGHYGASLIFKLNALFLGNEKLKRAHKFWVGKPPQANIK